MALRVYTAQLPNPRARIAGYRGPDALDVTRGSGGPYGGSFAPSRGLLDEANRRKRRAYGVESQLAMVWSWYQPLYTEEMRASYRNNFAAWRALLAREGDVTLCCYCGTANRCHRRLLVAMLVAAGERLGLEVIDMGERK
jgi:uncharacterized protein YeaO (DUF488 family)